MHKDILSFIVLATWIWSDFFATNYNRQISEDSKYQPAALLRMTPHNEDSVKITAKTSSQIGEEDNHDRTKRKTRTCWKSREKTRNNNDHKRFRSAQTHVKKHNRRLPGAAGSRTRKCPRRNVHLPTTPRMKNNWDEAVQCIKNEKETQNQCSNKARNSSSNIGKQEDVIVPKIRQSTTDALVSIPFSNYHKTEKIYNQKGCELSGEDVACNGCGGTPCYWTQYSRDIQLHVNMKDGARKRDTEGHKTRRLNGYKKFCLERHGSMEKGCRTQLLVCEKKAVRAIWLDPSGHKLCSKNQLDYRTDQKNKECEQ